MNSQAPAVGELDKSIIASFWDAELIMREGDSNAYIVWPREPRDESVAASIGAAIVNRLVVPVVVWRNDCEET